MIKPEDISIPVTGGFDILHGSSDLTDRSQLYVLIHGWSLLEQIAVTFDSAPLPEVGTTF